MICGRLASHSYHHQPPLETLPVVVTTVFKWCCTREATCQFGLPVNLTLCIPRSISLDFENLVLWISWWLQKQLSIYSFVALVTKWCQVEIKDPFWSYVGGILIILAFFLFLLTLNKTYACTICKSIPVAVLALRDAFGATNEWPWRVATASCVAHAKWAIADRTRTCRATLHWPRVHEATACAAKRASLSLYKTNIYEST